MGRVTVVPGQVVSAAHMNLAVDQGVMAFANTAARDAAIPTASEGMMCYLQDTGTMQMHNGFRWVGDVSVTYPMTGATGWNLTNLGVQMDAFGEVTVRGNVAATSPSSSLVATLPANYKPTTDVHPSVLIIEAGVHKAGYITVSAGNGQFALSGYGTIGSVAGVIFQTTFRASFKAVR